mmetsp:Transcript_3860/g.8602  ORF Transcript_3860/g.8602 Transcript_3860/m.8602 type:complete len:379 (+) Transcript_3860:1389-2525(+)
MRNHIHWLGIRSSMTKRLHDQIGTESQTRQTLQFITGHWSGGILTSHRGHGRLAVLARLDTSDSTGLAHHFLRERISGFRFLRLDWHGEDITDGGIATECHACLGRQSPSDNEGDSSPSPHFIQQNICLQFELGNDLIARSIDHFPLPRININHIPRVQIAHVHFNGQCPRILHGIEKDRCNLTTNANTAGFDVGYIWNIFAHEPKHGIGGGLSRGTGSHDITNVCQWMSLLHQLLHLTQRSNVTVDFGFDALTFILEHGQCMQWNIGTTPRILSGGQIIRIRLPRDLEDGNGDFIRHVRFGRVPFRSGPRFQYRTSSSLGFRCGIRRVVNIHHIVKGIEYQESVLQLLHGGFAEFCVRSGEECDEGPDVVSALHGAQ